MSNIEKREFLRTQLLCDDIRIQLEGDQITIFKEEGSNWMLRVNKSEARLLIEMLQQLHL